MMACTATAGHLLAAPFAILGSIGVVGQTLNFYKTLDNWGVEPLTFRSAEAKAPVTATGPVTREGMAAVQSMLDDVHRAFVRRKSIHT
jgi:serine protease SohB